MSAEIENDDLKPEVRQLQDEITWAVKETPGLASAVRGLLQRAHTALGECSRVSCSYCFQMTRVERGRQVEPVDKSPMPIEEKN